MLRSSKKLLALLLVILIFSVIMTGCGGTNDTPPAETPEETPEEAPEETSKPDDQLKIGYIVNFASHEWYKNVIKGQEDTAKELGIEYEVGDANGDIAKQISVGENLLAKDVDALIITPVDAVGVMPLIEQALAANVPVITEAVITEKQTAYVGIDDFTGGYLDGKYAGVYVKENNLPTPKALLVGFPALEPCVNRTEGFKKGLLEVIPEATFVEVDGGGMKDKAMAVATDALTANPDINMMMGINDDSTLGAIQAYKAAGLDESKVVAFGFGVEGEAAKAELLTEGSLYKAGLAMFPEYVGRLCVETAVRAIKGEELPDIVRTPIGVMDANNVNTYYTKVGDIWEINWPEVEKLGYKEENLD